MGRVTKGGYRKGEGWGGGGGKEWAWLKTEALPPGKTLF